MFSEGDKVVIVQSNYKVKNLNGMVGIIEKYWPDARRYGIRIEGLDNPRSAYRLWWLERSAIKIYIEEEIKMLPGYKIAQVRFLDGNTDRTYPYALYESDIIHPGDKVAVQTAHRGVSVAEVIEIYDDDGTKLEGREIICKLDFSAFEARGVKMVKIMELEEAMKKKADELQNIALYQLLAEKSPEMKEMLDEYTNLMK